MSNATAPLPPAEDLPTREVPINVPLPEDDHLAADDSHDTDSAYSGSYSSDTVSVNSASYRGYVENGRRYQSHADKPYFQPTDDKQWESQEANHLAFLILDCQKENQLFRAKLSEDAQYVLDLGTGGAYWAIEVADRFENLLVYGVDLYPPPQQWVPPNCTLEVDDVTRPWTWKNKWDLIHIRHLLGSFDNKQWSDLYREAYKNCAPGGWVEQLENDIGWCTDDNSLPEDNPLHHNNWRNMLLRCAEKGGRPMDTYDHMQRRIEAAGFTNTHVQEYKMPIGTWPKHPVFKDAGRVAKVFVLAGVEGWVQWLLTNFGEPVPWSVDEVKTFVDAFKAEMNKGHRIYLKVRRVWAQKPYEAATASRHSLEALE